MASGVDNAVGDYKPGSITKIRLKNFLTYKLVEFEPGPRLNMVVGANGTGKSTILCAICLGLGGEPKLLGRADDARAFIMHEQPKAMIEIHLQPHKNKAPHVIKRRIDRDKGSERGNGRGASIYAINDKKVTQKEVLKLVQETYNITIDNLCTFLPQDKVGSFSGFNQQELLQETEKTLSASQHCYHAHMKLIEMERELNSGDHNVDTIKAKLEKLQTEKARYEAEKKRMEEREAAMIERDLIKKKILWLEYNKVQAEVCELKDQKTGIKNEYKQSIEELKPLEEESQELAEKQNEVEIKCRTLDQKMAKLKRSIATQKEKYGKLEDEVETKLVELKAVDSEKNQKKVAYEKHLAKVESYEEQMKPYPPFEEIEQAYQQTSQEKRDTHRHLMNARKECDELRGNIAALQHDADQTESKLSKLLDEKAQRKRIFFKHNPQQQKVAEFIHKNKKSFRRNVYGPIAVEVTPKSKNTAAFLEQHVPNAVLKGFVVEDKGDYDYLYKEIREKRQLPLNVTLVRNGELKEIRRMYSDTKMDMLKRQHGVIGYLDETFSAPDAVMQALRSQATIHKVLVGSEQTQKSIDERDLLNALAVPDESLGQIEQQGSVIFASKGNSSRKYQTEVSRYSKKISTRIDDVFPAKMLALGSNPLEKKRLQDELEAIHKQLNKLRPCMEDAEKKKAEIECRGQVVSERATKAKSSYEDFKKMSQKLKQAKAKANDAKMAVDEDDAPQKKKILIQEIQSQVRKITDALETQGICEDQLMEATFSTAGTRIDKDAIKVMKRKVDGELLDKKQSHDALERRIAEIATKFDDAKKRLKMAKAEASKVAPIKDSEGNPTELWGKLQELEYEELEDAEAALEEAQQKIESIHNDPNAIKQYNEVCEEVELVQGQLEEMEGNKSALGHQIQQVKDSWLSSITNCIIQLNASFVKYMAEVQCTGEIRLKKGGESGDEDCDYKKWGIEIRVSFREGVKAQVLSAQVQSGGERAVSTIMYLMALQEMMVCPFRAVDEINQGLDERNERLVFRRIVQNSTRPPKAHPADHEGQYFLITPKLLPNMIDMENEAVTPLIVMNGPWNVAKPKDFDVARIVRAITRDDNGGRKRAPGPEDDEENEHPNLYSQSSPNSYRRKKRRS